MSWVLIDGMVNQKIVAHQEWQIDDPEDILTPPIMERYAVNGSIFFMKVLTLNLLILILMIISNYQ